jgi:hypothetical protein
MGCYIPISVLVKKFDFYKRTILLQNKKGYSTGQNTKQPGAYITKLFVVIKKQYCKLVCLSLEDSTTLLV